ncbi:hypothetical protein AB0B63_18620 [Micromonospora sp. NPDC049081]|uniref:hypothetical protein n=1 Tax=Micromonospora sp. NPDC049081 TaxID=3155150 RepID=UPI0033C75544
MRWWTWLRAWLSSRATLAARLVKVEAERDRLAAQVRRLTARREVEAETHRREMQAARRELEALDAANRAVDDRLRREVIHGTRQAQRLNQAHQFAAQLPDDLAAELRALVTPQIAAVEGAPHAR